MSVASSAPGWDPVALVGSCVCPCRSVRQVRLKPIRVGGVGYRHPMLARLLVRVGWSSSGVQGYGWVQEVGLVVLPGRCPGGVGPSLVGHVGGEGCAGRGRRPGDIRWRGGVVLRYWCSSCSTRAAPLSDRPRHTRCRPESSRSASSTGTGRDTGNPTAPRSERSLPQPGPRARGVVGVSRR